MNRNLNTARKEKNDEFYTRYQDIENELQYYKSHFKNKTIYCNCDDALHSNFVQYFIDHFNEFKLRKLIVTGFPLINTTPLQYEFNEVGETKDIESLLKNPKNISKSLYGWGDFRSPECIELMQQADIIITNPPFSQFREFLTQILKSKKKFLLVGHMSIVLRKFVTQAIVDDKLWLGVTRKEMKFVIPAGYEKKHTIDKDGNHIASINNAVWYTNIDHGKYPPPIILTESYCEENYPTFDNSDIININLTRLIPKDYSDKMAVPVSFIKKWNKDQFNIIGSTITIAAKPLLLNNKTPFTRFVITNKQL